MSFLTLSNVALNSNKVVISVWFKVPKATADVVGEQSYMDVPIFNGIVPLIVFGRQPTAGIYDRTTPVIGQYYVIHIISVDEIEFVPVDVLGVVWRGPRPISMQPTSIGVRVWSNAETNRPEGLDPATTGTLDLNIHASGGTAAGTEFGVPGFVPTYYTNGMPSGIDHYIYEDASYVTSAKGDVFGNTDAYGSGMAVASAGKPFIEFDKWHHLLLSWDMTSSGSHGSVGPHDNPIECVTSFSRMWCAVDDENKAGADLPAAWLGNLNSPPEGPGITDADPNAHVSEVTFDIAGGEPDSSYSIGVSLVADRVSIPAELEYKSNTSAPADAVTGGNEPQPDPISPIVRVEMAEFQMWTGVTLDTSVESNRRAFIDYERDENGNPVKDKDGKATLKPVPMDKAEELLKKKPEIKLHGSSKWIKGKNTGTTGMDYDADPPQEKPEGQFEPTGGIEAYKPDPSLQQKPAP